MNLVSFRFGSIALSGQSALHWSLPESAKEAIVSSESCSGTVLGGFIRKDSLQFFSC